MKKIVSMMLVIAMALGTFALPAFAAENANVAKIGETEYATLAEAVKAANASTEAGAVEIELIADTTFDKALTVSRDVVISGAKTITRAYAGSFLTVKAGATLTLKDITIDGNNNWFFDKAAYMADMATGAAVATKSYVIHQANAPVANKVMITVNGNVIMDGSTIKNNAGAGLFTVTAGGSLTMNDATVDHNTKVGSSVVAEVAAGATWTINKGTVISNNHNGNGNGTLSYMKGKTVMNGGKIIGNTGVNCNGSVMMLYGAKAYFEMNGGEISDNGALRGKNNGWNPAFYVYGNGATFIMNDGVISSNYGTVAPGVVTNGDNATVTINGGSILYSDSSSGKVGTDVYSIANVTVTEDATVTESHIYNNLTVSEGATLCGDVWFDGAYFEDLGNNVYSGTGNIDGNVTVYGGSKTDMTEGAWLNGTVLVNAVSSASALSVKSGAVINGIQVRVLDSVASGSYLNAEEAAAAQASSYIEEAGANVTSPVLFYHRLTSAQKSDIVVTFDYNGGLDAQGWSGCQITSAEGFAPAAPAPTKDGFFLVGWEYALDSNPESLDMEGYAAYNGEMIANSLRLVAKWAKPAEAIVEGKVEFNGHISAGDFTFALLDSEGNKIATATNDENGEFTFTVKDVIPGDYSYTVDQIEGTDEEIVYDEAMINVSVTVNEDGTCVANPEIAVFTNSIVEPATQTISGSVYLDGELADGFEFVLVDADGNVVDTATSENGIFTFDEIVFEEAYTARYTISQIIPEITGNVKYDENEITVSVVITRDGDRYSATYSILRATEVSFSNTTFHIHTEAVVEGKAPTCTETGLTDGAECSECGETLTAQEEIPANGHTAGDEIIENVVEATEIAGGSYEIAVYCTVCGAELSREYFVTDPIVTEAPEETTEVPEETTEPEEEITEEPTPLDPAPETTEPKVEITEPEIPLNPDTGDASVILVIAAIASIALAALYIKRRQVIED